MRGGMCSVAELFVAQMQDYLGLGEGHRMNTPGTQGGNWHVASAARRADAGAGGQASDRMTTLYGRKEQAQTVKKPARLQVSEGRIV